MVPNDEEFDEEIISFGALTSAKAIYEKISEILSRCRKFVLIMSNYKDYTIGFPNSQAEIQFKNLAAFYAWSSNGSTLKTTPFLSQCIEFNNSFISLFKILNKSGCKIQNLKINEKDLKNSDLIQSIMKPKQSLLSVEQFKKDWVMVSRKPLNLNMPLKPNLPDHKKKPNPQENKNNGTIVTVIPKKELEPKISLNSQQGRGSGPVKDEDVYKYMIDNIDKPQNYSEDMENKPGLGIDKIDDIAADTELPIDKFIDYATETTFNIVNYANKLQINTNSQIVLLLDIKSITPEDIKRDILLYFVAFAMACSQLGLEYRLVVFADREFQYLEIKKLSEKLQRKHLQVALETFDTKRLSSDPFIAIQKIINKDLKSSYSFFVFSDGNLLNTTVKSWSRWDKNTHSTCTWLIQPPEEFNNPIVNQYKRLNEEYENMFYEVNKIVEGGFDKCEKFIETFFKGFSKGNLENKEKTVKLSLSQNKIKITCSPKHIQSTNSHFICVSENLQTSMTRICEVTDNSEFDFIPKSNNSEFDLEDFERNISDNFNTEEMFSPNKAMQYIASEKGNGISMPGLIRFIITDGQDQRFRLEKKAGYVPSYSLFFVIDCTESSSGMLSMNTTVLTVFSTLIAFKECNCPITVILATSTGPVAVCINKKKEDIFIDNSPVFTEIYRWLTAANIQSQTVFGFSQALTAAYNIRCRQQEQESVLIAITSAHFYQTEMGAVGTCISTVQSLKTSTIGVGVGICPKNISKVFSKSVWSDNPLKIGECFSKLSHLDTSEGITEGEITSPVLPEKISIEELNGQLSNKDNRFYTDLTNKLEKIQIFDAARGYYINEKTTNIDVPSTKSGQGQEPKSNLPDEDLGKNAKWPYKILICQLYDATVNQEGEQNKQEPNPPSRPLSSQQLPPQGIQNQGIQNQGNQGIQNQGNQGIQNQGNQGIQNQGNKDTPETDKDVTFQTLNDENGIICRLRDLGFTVTVSQNYCNCIAEILSGTNHQVWVICSNGKEAKPSDAEVLPNIKNKSDQIRGDTSDFSHAYQFVETVEMFRQKGGSISFWADQGFTFESDYYLKHVKLYDCDECDSKS
ncbi:hypothetical protein TVAG_439100 [Trichomonas vaginalis G3]|uniref:VWFA domain-containing protein n=1 Tax=Trichomonas vaginalis (strain ATCC PRA-98 / G3) TaxID=412133 RepID=A2FQX7_TRIV3|nr:nuclear chaperone required for maturation and nuclear export of pre-60s ribosome subunits [Trichomonas vaginalis G3]EAX92682.1 hypothetical protein TVAG_439100 [Trichomonas vaginalis G3]KAI5552995.1 nuclear chaperone required for maturation and nuclear export of pre-60s ribosome subunits [Trichomonas vaginalis G3]|eukprot:XP_001305612.1 hypothetical protein [Trichomonas vaginalis G3]